LLLFPVCLNQAISIRSQGENRHFTGPAGHRVPLQRRLEGGRIRFDINLDADERADLKISSRLLSLARSVVGNRK